MFYDKTVRLGSTTSLTHVTVISVFIRVPCARGNNDTDIPEGGLESGLDVDFGLDTLSDS